MKISHTPVAPRRRIGWRRPSQMLKSPTTETRSAFGAQTAKCTPSTPSWVISRRPAPSRAGGGCPRPAGIRRFRPEPGRSDRDRPSPIRCRRPRRAAGRAHPDLTSAAKRPAKRRHRFQLEDVARPAPPRPPRRRAGTRLTLEALAMRMRAEHRKRIAVAALDDRAGGMRVDERRLRPNRRLPSERRIRRPICLSYSPRSCGRKKNSPFARCSGPPSASQSGRIAPRPRRPGAAPPISVEVGGDEEMVVAPQPADEAA